MAHFALRTFIAVAVTLALLFGGDQLFWAFHGYPADHVGVAVLTVASLKGNKEDYSTAEIQQVPCASKLLPFPTSQGNTVAPCWWVRRHTQIVHHY